MAAGTATASYDLRFDSGRICLDLTATTHPGERLDCAGRLRAWVVASGLVPAGTPLTQVDGLWLLGFRELRGHISRLVRGELDGRPADGALARVNAAALAAPPAPWAVRADDGALRRRLHTAARLRRTARGGGPGRPRPAHRPAGAGESAPVRGRQLPDRLSGHLARPAATLVFERGVRQSGARGPAPSAGGAVPRLITPVRDPPVTGGDRCGSFSLSSQIKQKKPCAL